MSWCAVDGSGTDLATGRLPEAPGAPSPAAAVAAAPVASWPLAVVGSDGSRIALADALGPGGDIVELLLSTLAADGGSSPVDVHHLVPQTPAGTLDLPVCDVSLPEAVEAARAVEPAWLAAVEQRRSAPRLALIAAGRELQLEAALHMVMLIGAERLDPDDDTDVDAHVASGAMLWILAAGVTWALVPDAQSPFAPWAELVCHGVWPVGPSRGRMVLSSPR